MFKEKELAISVFCLAISIIIGAGIIANSIKSNGDYVSSGLNNMSQGMSSIGNSIERMDGNNVVSKRNTYNLTAASTYLGISTINLLDLVNSEVSGIPYLKIGNEYVLDKNALDKWLETARVEID